MFYRAALASYKFMASRRRTVSGIINKRRYQVMTAWQGLLEKKVKVRATLALFVAAEENSEEEDFSFVAGMIVASAYEYEADLTLQKTTLGGRPSALVIPMRLRVGARNGHVSKTARDPCCVCCVTPNKYVQKLGQSISNLSPPLCSHQEGVSLKILTTTKYEI